MRQAKGWRALACLLVWATAAHANAQANAGAQVDLEPYLRRDLYGSIKISPDGRYYAAIYPQEDRTGLAVIRRADKVMTARIIGEKDSVVDEFWWANDERVLVSMAQKLGP